LISVSNKSGVVVFARGIQRHGLEILSTGGTARILSENEIKVQEAPDFPVIRRCWRDVFILSLLIWRFWLNCIDFRDVDLAVFGVVFLSQHVNGRGLRKMGSHLPQEQKRNSYLSSPALNEILKKQA